MIGSRRYEMDKGGISRLYRHRDDESSLKQGSTKGKVEFLLKLTLGYLPSQGLGRQRRLSHDLRRGTLVQLDTFGGGFSFLQEACTTVLFFEFPSSRGRTRTMARGGRNLYESSLLRRGRDKRTFWRENDVLGSLFVLCLYLR